MSIHKSNIHDLPRQIQPRERLLEFGEKALSDGELLAIVLRTGTREANVLSVAQQVLNQFEDLSALKFASLSELQAINGIGPTKAIEMKAAIEFGWRVANARAPKLGSIISTTMAGQWLMKEMGDLQQEHLVALYLNTKNEIIKKKTIFLGTVSSSTAHPREIFREAVKFPTARIILAHNHPSGNLEPSQADLLFTKRMIQCGDFMGIEILDHLIVGFDNFLSLREESSVFVAN